FVGVDRDHAGGGARRRGVDPRDRRVRMRRAQHGGISLARQIDVVGVPAGAGDEADVFLARDGLTDTELTHAALLPVPYSGADFAFGSPGRQPTTEAAPGHSFGLTRSYCAGYGTLSPSAAAARHGQRGSSSRARASATESASPPATIALACCGSVISP